MNAGPKNRVTKYEAVQYGSGVWNGRWVVRRQTTEDVAATLTQQDAFNLIRDLEAADRAGDAQEAGK